MALKRHSRQAQSHALPTGFSTVSACIPGDTTQAMHTCFPEAFEVAKDLPMKRTRCLACRRTQAHAFQTIQLEALNASARDFLMPIEGPASRFSHARPKKSYSLLSRPSCRSQQPALAPLHAVLAF